MLHINKKFKTVLRKFFPYIKLKIEGNGCEQFINICLRRKIDIWDADINSDKATLCISSRSYKKNVRSIVRKTGVKTKIVEKQGFTRKIRRYRLRIPLAMYLLTGALAVTYCSSFVWHINITGGNIKQRDSVIEFLEQENVRPGTNLGKINTKELGNRLLLSVDSLKWATVSKRGTMLDIEILSKDVFAEEEDISDVPGSIVAKKDALIKKIVAESGTAVINENNVVLKGETIISGLVYPIDEIYGTEPRAVCAKGKVMGIVRYTANVPVETEAEVYRLSGRSQKALSLSVFGKKISFSKKCNFSSFNKVTAEDSFSLDLNHILPVSIVRDEYYETICEKVHFNEEEAREYATLKAMQEIDDIIPEDAIVADTGGEFRDIDGVTCYCIWAECEESIGEYMPLHLEK